MTPHETTTIGKLVSSISGGGGPEPPEQETGAGELMGSGTGPAGGTGLVPEPVPLHSEPLEGPESGGIASGGVSGGSPSGAEGGDGSSAGDQAGSVVGLPPGEDKPLTLTIKGKPVTKPLSAWLKLASKWEGLGGDSLVQTAAAARRLDRALKILGDPSSPLDVRLDANREVWTRMGLSEAAQAEAAQRLISAYHQMEEENMAGTDTEESRRQEDQESMDMEESGPSDNLNLESIRRQQENSQRVLSSILKEHFDTIVRDAVDSSPRTRVYWEKIKAAHTPEVLSRIKGEYQGLLAAEIYRRADLRRREGGHFSLSIFRDVLPEAEEAALSQLGPILGALSLGRAPDTTASVRTSRITALKEPPPGASSLEKSQFMEDYARALIEQGLALQAQTAPGM